MFATNLLDKPSPAGLISFSRYPAVTRTASPFRFTAGYSSLRPCGAISGMIYQSISSPRYIAVAGWRFFWGAVAV
ncbi:MAG: hypothetical protein LBP75_02680 [Planctomycetota bacterium]|nr:hypothetical protein [Planctomycetota bacterium]